MISRLRIFIHDKIYRIICTQQHIYKCYVLEKRNQEIYKICKDFSKLIEKKDDKRFHTRSSIICINNPATRRESGKWLCKIVTFYRIICPRRSHNAGRRISRASRMRQRKRMHGRGIFAEQADEWVLPPREWHISKGYSRIRSRMRDYRADKTMSELYFQRWNVWNRAKSILHSNVHSWKTFGSVIENEVKFRIRKYHRIRRWIFLKEESKKGLVINRKRTKVKFISLDWIFLIFHGIIAHRKNELSLVNSYSFFSDFPFSMRVAFHESFPL